MKKIAVTGGSGKLGTRLVNELQAQGYEVVSLDQKRSPQLRCRQLELDLTDFGQVAAALSGADAVVHMAAIPAPLGYTYPVIFANNVVSGYNVLEAASMLGIRKVVMGSSESSYGFAWAPARFSPDYLPLDEDHPQLPQECYGLSKIVNEQTAAMFDRRNGMQVISLRFSMITTPEEYSRLAINEPERYKHILWSYIDIRDAVDACVASLKAEDRGAVCLNITSSDTLSDRETASLLKDYYPDVVDLRSSFQEREAIVSNRRAREVLGWSPRHSWSDERKNGEDVDRHS
ncbi:NAD-dependent epimerase/dehydratase family protein [Paenibacillus soyae]|uniref:NAD(P)-dependent oxidoreductase n=1 Tax=Paenibacillus soyae TaxID=2969249 RepID=A0A9X2MVH4_9BACL|nr:NAD(P)-dependent oxidoreductase [Paenibacillus soyae]MCR2807059.1 NAD(P)-dependent oxidoreductase [Paenibacillus soyae]